MRPLFAAFHIAVAAVRWTWLFGWALWRWLVPLWRFRDASRGTPEQRVANYRYNREQRKYLPGYLLKWAILCALLLASHQLARELLLQLPDWEPLFRAWVMLSGIGFTVGFALMANIIVAWSFLTFMD